MSDEAIYDGDSCNLVELTFEEMNVSGSPIRLCCIACLFFTILVFVLSELSRNYSQTDKIWSITPFVYTWILVCDTRTLLMAVISTVWGCRLTWNFNRRGGYKWPPWEGDEDYRWKYLQDGMLLSILQNNVAWTIFNVVFISLYQHVLLFVVTAPSIVAHVAATKCATSGYSSSLNGLDILACLLYLGFVLLEGIADNQQYAFQTEKYRRKGAGETLDGEYLQGFKTSGLFSIVRKPNYACEQALWVSFGLFSLSTFQSSIARQSNIFNWSHVGWVLYVLLFQGSGPFTEKITLTKYPLYAEYMKETPLFFPNILKLLFGKGKKVSDKKSE
uniref:Steroid 5-alpha reductase C-terminal domain-containing protein n=1 Tax=Pseudo-nitzschia delicatissima TaxID=44447 RepID=A0A7S0TCI9_9STRA|mmetsp:Transcript_1551/g.3607  ORF Transcript_1551/g.3607 Transcript_1551/m.3607 type:complete len:331 (+) Transcript_1551:362-1354(+)